MKKIIMTLALCAAFILPQAANAQNTQEQGSGPNPFVECGIGAALFPDLHWAAAISNVIWDLGSTAVTSALSSPQMCNAKKVKTATLILETLPELEKDLAMGDGEFVVALAGTMGCSAHKDTIVADMRQSYAKQVANVDYVRETTPQRATAMYISARDAANEAGCVVAL